MLLVSELASDLSSLASRRPPADEGSLNVFKKHATEVCLDIDY